MTESPVALLNRRFLFHHPQEPYARYLGIEKSLSHRRKSSK